MYAYMNGKIAERFDQGIILEVNDIGYNIYMSEQDIGNLEKSGKVKIYTYYEHKEEYTRIFGFSDKKRLEFFKKLISVNGVGAKMGIAILGALSIESLATAIVTDDINVIKSAPGVGPKLAAKIALELKDKVTNDDMIIKKQKINSKELDEAVTALKVLGYSDKEIEAVSDGIEYDGKSVQEIIKAYLKCFQLNK